MKTTDEVPKGHAKMARSWEIFSSSNDKSSVDTVDNACFTNNNHIPSLTTLSKQKESRISASNHITANGGGGNTLKKSVAKIFGKNYDIKKSLVYKNKKPVGSPKLPRKSNHEKFYGRSWEDPVVRHSEEKQEGNGGSAGPKPFRSLSRSFGKLLRRNHSSVDISIPDPEYKVSYLGNVLTSWAKGDGCADKPLATLWKNFIQNKKSDVVMRLRVCPSGLKASTKQHGLTEYWAHRVTFCSAPKDYPRVFCWIYRHEGKKLRHELRCHAVLCSKESIATDICNQLKENLEIALREFKREKVNKQNARLSLANCLYENPSMPKRKIMLSVGSTNYRPPLERSKSAPKLMAIEEAIGEEDEEDDGCETPQISDKPAGMSLERPRRRNSFRRRYQRYSKSFSHDEPLTTQQIVELVADISTSEPMPSETHSSDEDFDELLKKHKYESDEVLCTDFLTYLNLRLDADGPEEAEDAPDAPPPVSSLDLLDDFSAPSSLVCLPKQRPEGDGGSLSSGCDTSSSITAIMDDLKTPLTVTVISHNSNNTGQPQSSLARRRYESCTSDATPHKCVTFQRSITIPAPGQRTLFLTPAKMEFKEVANNLEIIDSDSDESGYVEFQEQTTSLFKETCT